MTCVICWTRHADWIALARHIERDRKVKGESLPGQQQIESEKETI